MKALEKLIPEIGLNHLGNEEILNDYVSKIISLKFQNATIQIREKEFYIEKNESLQLEPKIINKAMNKLKQNNVKVGLAVCEDSFVELTDNFSPNFFKVLSWKADDISFINFLEKFRIPIYLSLGMLSEQEIFLLLDSLEGKKNIKLIHTQLNYEIQDLNLKFMNTLSKKSNFPVSYGHHAKNNIDPIIMSISYEPEKIFFYIKLNSENKFPDNDHALNINQIHSFIEKIDKCIVFLGENAKKETENFIDNI